MHILILPAWYPEHKDSVHGVFFRDQAQALSRYGHQVGVIAPMMQSLRQIAPRSWFSARFEDDQGVRTYRRTVPAFLPRVPYGNYYLFLKAAEALLSRYIKEQGKPDILHAHASIFAGAAGAALSERFAIPLVLTEHSSGFSRSLYANWQLTLSANAVRYARRCIAVSPALGETMHQLMSDRFGVEQHWHWVPNVVAERFMMPYRNPVAKRPFRVLNLAMMTPNKGQEELLTAFSLLTSEKNIPAELWMGGDGEHRRFLETKAQQLNLEGRVSFLGKVPPQNVPALLREVDVMVISSHFETFGVVAAEALCSGVPVISTRCGGPECIVEEGDGLLVPVADPEALAEAMQALASAPELRQRKNIAQRAQQRFSGQAVAHALTAIYQDALS